MEEPNVTQDEHIADLKAAMDVAVAQQRAMRAIERVLTTVLPEQSSEPTKRRVKEVSEALTESSERIDILAFHISVASRMADATEVERDIMRRRLGVEESEDDDG